MDLQTVIVILVILAAVIFAGRMLVRKSRSFAPKAGCDSDCGCNGASKKLTS